MRPFFALPETRWDQPAGKLHLYIVAPDPVRELAAKYHEVMHAHGDLVSLQPLEWLHMTVQMLQAYTSRGAARTGLMDEESLQHRLRTELGGFEPFDVTVGPAVVGVHAVSLWSPPPAAAFTELVARCRAAVGNAFGEQVLAGPPKQPHITIGYGRTAGDSDALIRSVKDVWAAPVTFTVPAVELVAVTQDPVEGRYSWSRLDHIELPPAGNAARAAGPLPR
ncbi:2'-5' RNA ligase family protein [Kribbella sp. NPDC059898]|uniref:2'-5' RNA ligase family protein n=1 Tax=Kribbella sp. NPDC059898 TaxID=3346995 RepID=UPI00365F53CD